MKYSAACWLLALCPLVPATAGSVPQLDKNAVSLLDVWSLPGILGGGFKTSGDYVDANVFLTLPVYSTMGRDGYLEGDVLFVEPYTSWGEQGEVATSLGFGWRHLFSQQHATAVTQHDGHQAGFLEEGIFLGANLFVDLLDTQFDNRFWQLGFGIEAGTRYFEIHANYYLPLSDRQLALEQHTRQSFTSSRTSTSQQVTPLNSPYATGNSIAQDALFTTSASTVTTTTTIERLFRLFEDGMEGWDVEVSVLVPGLDRWMDVKLITGYYAFDNQPFGPQTGSTGNVHGWKAGLEVRPVPAIAVSAVWYEDERFVGGDWLYGMRLEIPFEAGDLGDGKGLWGRVRDAFTPRRRHLAERMVEPVRRQNQAVKVGNSTEEKLQVSSQTQTVTRVVSRSQGRLVLVQDVVFVNNGPAIENGIQAGSASGDGTAEKPKDTIQAGANLAQTGSNTTGRVWSVYTQGTATPYTEDVTTNAGGVSFISSGKMIPGDAGTAFGSGVAPEVNGGFSATSIPYFGLEGYSITVGHGLADGVRLQNVSDIRLVGNAFDRINDDSIEIGTSGDARSTVFISGNTLEGDAGDDAIVIYSENSSWLHATVSRNFIKRGFQFETSGLLAEASGTSNLTVLLDHNVVSMVDTAFDIKGSDASRVFLSATNNQLSSVGTGIQSVTTGTGMQAIIEDNTIDGASFSGIGVGASGAATVNASVARNRINGTEFYGIIVGGADSSVVTAGIHDNTVTDNRFIGIHIAGAGSSLTADIGGNYVDMNQFVFSTEAGIALFNFSPGNTMTVGIHENTVLNAITSGMDFATNNGANISVVSFDLNTINSGAQPGLRLLQDSGSLSVTGSKNNVIDVRTPGPRVRFNSTTPTVDFLLNGSAITQPIDVP